MWHRPPIAFARGVGPGAGFAVRWYEALQVADSVAGQGVEKKAEKKKAEKGLMGLENVP